MSDNKFTLDSLKPIWTVNGDEAFFMMFGIYKKYNDYHNYEYYEIFKCIGPDRDILYKGKIETEEEFSQIYKLLRIHKIFG